MVKKVGSGKITHAAPTSPTAKPASLKEMKAKVENFIENRGKESFGAGKPPTFSERPPSGTKRVQSAMSQALEKATRYKS